MYPTKQSKRKVLITFLFYWKISGFSDFLDAEGKWYHFLIIEAKKADFGVIGCDEREIGRLSQAEKGNPMT